jgi:hypothetical protein
MLSVSLIDYRPMGGAVSPAARTAQRKRPGDRSPGLLIAL